MIESDLKHTIKYKRIVDGTTVDDYGQPEQTETAYEKKCFYDFPKEEVYVTRGDNKIKVEAVVFMSKDDAANIQLDDTVTQITNALGNSITDKELRVIDVRKANDLEGVHHLEVKLGKA